MNDVVSPKVHKRKAGEIGAAAAESGGAGAAMPTYDSPGAHKGKAAVRSAAERENRVTERAVSGVLESLVSTVAAAAGRSASPLALWAEVDRELP